MKTHQKFYVLISMALVILFTACKKDDVEEIDFDAYGEEDVDLLCVANNSPYAEAGAEDINPIVFDNALFEGWETTDEDSVLLNSNIKSIADFIKELIEYGTSSVIHQVKGSYKTIDEHGLPIRLSGKLFLPKSGDVKALIIANHFTIGSNAEAPSENFCFEGIYAAAGYAVIMADYIGYGLTKDRIHPYLHVESTARASVDIALAAQRYMKAIGRAPQTSAVYILGYSQGGAVALSVQKRIEEEYADKINIIRTFAGAGPYDLVGTYDISIAENKTGIPCAVPMIIQGINQGDALGLGMKDFFKGSLLENYNEWINSKEYTVKEINKKINTKYISEILTTGAMNKNNAKTKILYESLQKNSLLSWTPKAPLYMFHSKDDKTVPFLNSEHAQNAFTKSSVEYNFGNYGSHQNAAIKFLITVGNILPK